MSRSRFTISSFRLFAAASAIAVSGSSVRGQQAPPRFQSSVELTSFDATVVDSRGRPILTLQPADFTVRIDGKPRRVVSAEWVSLKSPEGRRPPPPPEGYSSNENATGGRLILIVVDQPNIEFGGVGRISAAVGAFLDRLEPSDRVAAVALGQGGIATPFTGDRERVKEAISRMTGSDRRLSAFAQFNVAISEAFDIFERMPFALERVVARECLGAVGDDVERCSSDIQGTASTIVSDAEIDALQTMTSLRALLDQLRTIDAPKTLVLVSGGFVMRDESSVADLGSMALAARSSIYVLKIDAGGDIANAFGAPTPVSSFNDRFVRSQGLEILASASRGSLFEVSGSASGALESIETELSGYYMLGIESDPADKDGKAHPVKIAVDRRGATVRSRRQLMAIRDEKDNKGPHEALITALNSPLLVPALPIRVATFSLLGPETEKIQLLIHADIGGDYAASKSVALAYTIADSSGHIVDSHVADARLPPVMNGVPSPLQFTGGASLPPGEYTLKLGAAEGDRVGTVEHTIHATLVEAGQTRLSELMVGGPSGTIDLTQPSVGTRVSFGAVQGYVEAYGQDTSRLKVKYEVATTPEAPALLDADVTARTAGDERTIFTYAMPVRQLPPGQYYLRAVVSDTDGIVKTMARPFEVAAPAVLMTSAEGIGAVAIVPSEIYLPVGDEMFARPFKREDASRPDTLRAFQKIVAPDARSAFDQGLAFLEKGDYIGAEESFKNALDIANDSTAALAYLAATYAASGHDAEAASAWQTSLIEGSSFPQIYEWLGDALLRSRQLSEARAILEEASSKWPADTRFTLPLALVYATFGQGREAVRALERYLSAHSDDHLAQSLGVEWLYHLHAAGASARGAAEDLKLARTWADAYMKAKGPQAALVRQWVQSLETARRQ